MGILKLPAITTAQRTGMTPAVREILFDTTLNQVFIGDGTTAGGIAIGAGGSGDMLKSIYDTLEPGDGVVDAASSLRLKVKNVTGSTIPKGSVVYIDGAAGGYPKIVLADASTEPTSSKTTGITVTDINNGAEGYIVLAGILTDVNTQGFTVGDLLWLSETAGAFTATIPPKPAHTVFLGWIADVSATAGIIIVAIKNGYEIEELHDVNVTSISDKQGLFYNSTSGLWENSLVQTGNIANNAVTYAKLQNASTTSRLLGSNSTSSAITELSLSAAFTITSGVLGLSATADSNIYNTDGTLSANRNVALSTYRLKFTGSALNSVIESTGRAYFGYLDSDVTAGLPTTGAYDVYVKNTLSLNDLQASNSINAGGAVISGVGTNNGEVRVSNSGATVSTNIYNNYIQLPYTTAPTAASTKGVLFTKSTDKKIYWKTDTGTEYDLTLGGTGSMTWPASTGIAYYDNGTGTWGTSITDSAGLAGALSDETGFSAGAKAVFSISPQITTSITTDTTGTFSLITSGPNRIDFGSSAATINMGAAGAGTTTNIKSSTVVFNETQANSGTQTLTLRSPYSAGIVSLFDTLTDQLNIGSAATKINLGANSATFVFAGPNFGIQGSDPSISTATNNSTATAYIFNEHITKVRIFNAADTVTIGGGTTPSGRLFGTNPTSVDNTGSTTLNLMVGPTGSNFTKTFNIGTGGAAGHKVNVNVGSQNTLLSDSNTTFYTKVNIKGDLVVEGSTVTVNSSNLTIDDKTIDLAAVSNDLIQSTAVNVAVAGAAFPYTLTLTNIGANGKNLVVGDPITATNGSPGSLGGNNSTYPVITSIVYNTGSSTYTVTATIGVGAIPVAGTVTNLIRIVSTTGTVALSTFGGGIWSGAITNLTDTSNILVGSRILAAVPGTTGINTGNTIVTAVFPLNNSVSISSNATFSSGTVFGIYTTGATDDTANEGGIILKGSTDKTIIWYKTATTGIPAASWNLSEHINIPSGKEYYINGTSVLNFDTLGSGITKSSLTKIGTLNSGTSGSVVRIDGSGNLTADNSTYLTSGNTVTSFSGGSTGLTPNTATNGAVSLGGTLAVGSGGTGATAATAYALITGGTAGTAYVSLGTGTAGQILQSGGSAAYPSWVNNTTLTNPMIDVGSMIYGGSAGSSSTPTNLVPNTSTTKKFLTQTGNGSVSSAPVWNTIINGDIPNALSGKTYEGLTISSTSASTFTLANNKTFVVNQSITLNGTDNQTYTFPTASATLLGSNDTFYIGQTQVSLTRSSGLQTIQGINNIDSGVVNSLTSSVFNITTQGIAVPSTTPGTTGTINIKTGAITGNSLVSNTSGDITLRTGDSSGGTVGSVYILTGAGSNGSSITIDTHNGSQAPANYTSIQIGVSSSGDIQIGRSSTSTTIFGTLKLYDAFAGNIKALDPIYGGTGQTGYTIGDILYADSATTLTKLSTSGASAGNVLKLIASGANLVPSWGSGSTGTVNDGTLTFSISGTAATTGSAIQIGTGTGFSANTATNTTYDIKVGPALSALATQMSGSTTTGFLKKTGADTYGLDTNTYLNTGSAVTNNYVYAGPAASPSAAPTFRALVDADFATNTISFTKLTNIGSNYRVLGRNNASTQSVSVLQPDDVIAIINQRTNGILSLSAGGTGGSISASQGGVVYSEASALAVTNAGTAGQILVSNGTSAPSWSSSPSLSNVTYSIENLAGATVGSQAAITKDITIGSSSSATLKFFILPGSTASGKQFIVINSASSTNELTVYPPASELFQGQAANASVNIPLNGAALFVKTPTASTWTFTLIAGGGAGVSDGNKGDITVGNSGGSWTINNEAVTYAKIQNVAATSFLANTTNSAASVAAVSLSNIPYFSGGISPTPSATLKWLKASSDTVAGWVQNLDAADLSGTIGSTVLGNSTLYIGTTGVALNRASAVLALDGITQISSGTSNTLVLKTGDISTASTNTLAVTLRSGNASGTASNSGSVTIDSGTATTTAGTINIGTTNSPIINLGNVVTNTGISTESSVKLIGALVESTANVAGSTDAQGNGRLSNAINIITSSTASPGGVTLPPAVIGRKVVIINRIPTATFIKIYPLNGDSIDGQTANLPFGFSYSGSLPQNHRIEFTCTSANNWQSSLHNTVVQTSTAATRSTHIAGGNALDIPYQSSSGNTTFLPIGAADKILSVNSGGTGYTWVDNASGGGSPSTYVSGRYNRILKATRSGASAPYTYTYYTYGTEPLNIAQGETVTVIKTGTDYNLSGTVDSVGSMTLPTGATTSSLSTATATATTITYNSTGHPWLPGQVINITGMYPSCFNITGALVNSVSVDTFTVTNPGGFTATLATNSATITLGAGQSTVGMYIGQPIIKVSGAGVFAANTVVASITSATVFAVNTNPTTAGAVTFSVDASNNTSGTGLVATLVTTTTGQTMTNPTNTKALGFGSALTKTSVGGGTFAANTTVGAGGTNVALGTGAATFSVSASPTAAGSVTFNASPNFNTAGTATYSSGPSTYKQFTITNNTAATNNNVLFNAESEVIVASQISVTGTSANGTYVTYTVASHNFQVGNVVEVFGSSDKIYDVTGVVTATTSTSFTIPNNVPSGTASATGYAVVNKYSNGLIPGSILYDRLNVTSSLQGFKPPPGSWIKGVTVHSGSAVTTQKMDVGAHGKLLTLASFQYDCVITELSFNVSTAGVAGTEVLIGLYELVPPYYNTGPLVSSKTATLAVSSTGFKSILLTNPVSVKGGKLYGCFVGIKNTAVVTTAPVFVGVSHNEGWCSLSTPSGTTSYATNYGSGYHQALSTQRITELLPDISLYGATSVSTSTRLIDGANTTQTPTIIYYRIK